MVHDDNFDKALEAVEDTKLKLPKSVRLSFPWLSLITSLLLIVCFIYQYIPQLQTFYQVEIPYLNTQELLLVVLVLGCVYLFDMRRFLNKKHLVTNQIIQLEQQIKDTWKIKNEQQQRANTYSGRTDKLKAFISDKLLESIEFDEKFLHFKGIASEVRHNGVISFDKVMTALNKAIQQQSFLTIYEQQAEQEFQEENQQDKNGTHSVQTINSLANYQSAIDAMRYLWVLLDLSTADNMSLHIGNQLIECEEHYYQLQLDADKSLDSTQSIPSNPTFYPQQAALMTLSLLCDEPEIRDLISIAKINPSALEDDFEFKNELYYIQLEATKTMLGNPNHIVLLMENLIKNALFFTGKSSYKQGTDRIGIHMAQKDSVILLNIYNRGPKIENDLDKLFKLGFTTRKSKQHHGKGLGLFFVSEIVKGYQGSINVRNIENESMVYQLTVCLENEEIETHLIETDLIDGKMKTRFSLETKSSDSEEVQAEWLTEIKLETNVAIKSLKVCCIQNNQENQDNQNDYCDEILLSDENFEWLDPVNRSMPKWLIQVKQKKRKHSINFRALDISGVCFDVSLPCADNCI